MEIQEQNKLTGGREGAGHRRVPSAGQKLERDRMGQNLQKLNKKWEGKGGSYENSSETGGGSPDGGLLCQFLSDVPAGKNRRPGGETATLYPFQDMVGSGVTEVADVGTRHKGGPA